MSGPTLREYQTDSVQQLRRGVASGKRKQVLCSPTGSGKTEIACHMLDEATRKLSRALFIVDRIVLVDQTSARLDKYDIGHGVIQAGHWRWRPHERVQICSAQTLERRGIPPDIKVVFVDEAHGMRKKVTEFLETTDAVVIGLTATPFTKGMGKVYQGMVNVTTTNELIAAGYLVPLKIYAAKSIRTEGMKVIAGEWSEKEIEERGLEIIGDIVSEWIDKTTKHFGGPVKTIVFSATVAHGEELCKQFNAAGYNFQQISYKDGGDEHRRDLIEEFRKPDSTIHGLISCEIFTKGFDVSDVRCGVSARPYRKSLSSHIQQLGRVMRTHEGKDYGLWLCHAGNALRFREDVEDIFENGVQELDDGKREEKAKKEPTEEERNDVRCPACGYMLLPADKACPQCGKELTRRSLVETLPGELVELDGNKLNRSTSWDEKRAFIGGLRAFANAHGYNPGWVAHKFKQKFGVFPNDNRLRDVPLCDVTPEMLRWIKSQQIRFARRRIAA